MSRRIMGSASFFELQDHTGKIQVYIKRDEVCGGDPESTLYNKVFKKLLDIGDIVGIKGFVFITQTGELSVHCKGFTLLSKALRPLPVVKEKDGKVYVAMSDKLLFDSGSARVDKRGKEALGKLAEVLNKQSDIDVYIEGHTDSKPINTAQFKDNWDLSVIRATSVVRILTKDYSVNPLQIQPSGRGEYMPVADNESAEGRSKNRRTEIIMAPKLDKLYQMLQ